MKYWVVFEGMDNCYDSQSSIPSIRLALFASHVESKGQSTNYKHKLKWYEIYKQKQALGVKKIETKYNDMMLMWCSLWQ